MNQKHCTKIFQTDLLEVYSVVKDGELAVDVAKVGLRIVQPLQP